MDQRKAIFVTVVVLLVAAGGVGIWLWQREVPQLELAKLPSFRESEESLGGQIYERSQNPLSGEIPPTNPFEVKETNPLSNIYKNPFE
jgi:hypothetical protein